MSHRTHHGPLGPLHTERVFPEPAIMALLALVALCLAIGLAGCAGGGPLGNGLGETLAQVDVTSPNGTRCTATIRNGKDQTDLTLRGLTLCGGRLDELHAARSDGAAAALAAMSAQSQTWANVVPGIVAAGICEAGSLITGKPCLPPVPAKPVPATPPPLMLEAPAP